jgi:hypothetical protein
VPKPLAIDRPISPARENTLVDDRELLIPPPPKLADLTKPSPVDVPPEVKIDPAIKQASAAGIRAPIDNDPRHVEVPAEAMPAPPLAEGNPARVDKDEALITMKQIYQRAASNYARMDAFEARLTRRETIAGRPNPEEIIRFQFRAQPYSVHLKWIGGDRDAIGREVIYVQRNAASKLHILPSKADSFPLPPMRMSFAPDDPMVRSKSRHDIRDAGLGEAIKHFGQLLATIDKTPAQRSRLKYLGPIKRNEHPSQLLAIEEVIAPRAEALLPQGGKRMIYFDTSEGASGGLPVIVVTFDAANREVEYYCFDRFLFPMRLDDADFDPDRAWKK